jgi:hypothetical protein
MQQTKEALVGIVALAKEIVELSKDGLQPADVVVLASKVASDEVFRNKLLAAVQGLEQIPAELNPVTVEKVIDLVIALALELKK